MGLNPQQAGEGALVVVDTPAGDAYQVEPDPQDPPGKGDRR
jgi:hypothetical protein